MTHLDDLNAKARAAFANRATPELPTPTQYRGRDAHGEFLVTIFPADGNKPASAEITWRANEWDTFDPPVQLTAVPVSAWSGGAA
jgi:hypothetical protein